LEPYDSTRPTSFCRGNDILNVSNRCSNGNELHSRNNRTLYYPIRVVQGFSQYNPGFPKSQFFTTNYSLPIDNFYTSATGKFTLCVSILSNGVVPDSSAFLVSNGASQPTCAGSAASINFVSAPTNLDTDPITISKCAAKPRGYLRQLNTNLDTYVSIQNDATCGKIEAFVRGTDESYVMVNKSPINNRYYYNLTKRQNTAYGLTVCVAQVACGALPQVGDFKPLPTKISVIAPSKFQFPQAGRTTFTCDGSVAQSGCNNASNIGYNSCRVKSSDAVDNCVFSTPLCPVKRCNTDGLCAPVSVPIAITDNNGVKLTEGCSIRISAGNRLTSTFVNATSSIVDGLLNYDNYYQNLVDSGECNSFLFNADCECGTPINDVPSFGVKVQQATAFNVTYWPECIFFPMNNQMTIDPMVPRTPRPSSFWDSTLLANV